MLGSMQQIILYFLPGFPCRVQVHRTLAKYSPEQFFTFLAARWRLTFWYYESLEIQYTTAMNVFKDRSRVVGRPNKIAQRGLVRLCGTPCSRCVYFEFLRTDPLTSTDSHWNYLAVFKRPCFNQTSFSIKKCELFHFQLSHFRRNIPTATINQISRRLNWPVWSSRELQHYTWPGFGTI